MIKSVICDIMLLVFKENVLINKFLIIFFILLRLVCQNRKQTIAAYRCLENKLHD